MSILILWIILLSASFSVTGQKNLTAYEVLEKFKLPRGLLPRGVTDYDLNPRTGFFKVYFNATCQFPVDVYKIKYQTTVSGFIRTGRIRRLEGVSVKVVFLWVHISDVYRDGYEIDFSVGLASEEFEVRKFEESPQCGCGFDCHRLVSSS